MDYKDLKICKKHLFCEKVYYDYFNKVINSRAGHQGGLNKYDSFMPCFTVCKNWHPYELCEEYVERIKINTTYFVFI